MAAARERRISLYAYNTRADAEANTNGTEYTSGIVDDTPRYEHVFFTEFPGWGEANAAMFSCDISGTADLSDKWVRVKYSYYATDAATSMTDKWLFLGRVDSCRYDTLKTVRTLVAYDLLYWLRSVDISEYWANYWSNEDRNRSIAAFLSNMSADIGVTLGNIGATMLPTSTIAAAGAKATTLSGCSFVDMLAFIGQMCRVYFFIGGDGKLNCARTSNAETAATVDALIDTQNTEIGDGALPAYTAMMAYSGADVIYSTGSGEPLYTIRDNPLLNGKTTAEITTQLNALFSELGNVAGFWPGEFEYIVSSPEEFGNVATGAVTYTPNLSTQDGNETRLHAAAAVECWGVQLINQRVTCPTAMTTGGAVSASMSAALNAIQQMGVEMTYKVNADNVIEAVNLEAQGGVTINAQAININGVVSANNGFKVNLDGSVESTAGKIGGWIIDGEMLYKDVTISGTVYRVMLNAPTSPSLTTPAVVVRKRASGGSTWTDVSSILYSGKVISKDFEANGKVVIRPDASSQGTDKAINIIDGQLGTSLQGGLNVYYYNPTTNKTSYGRFASGTLFLGQADGDFRESNTPPDPSTADTVIGRFRLDVDGKDILRTHKSLVGGWGTEITQGKDLNTTEFLSVRRFFCPTDVTVATLSNCPTGNGFMMDVSAPIQAEIDNESAASGSRYRVRKILTWLGDMFTQACYFGSSGWMYGTWKKTPTSYTRQITTGGITWTVTQYADGYADLYADITLNGTWGSWGGMYYLQPVSTYALPITVQKKLADVTTYVTTDGSANSALPMNYTTTANENATTCALLRPAAGNNNTNYYCRKYIRAKV